MPDAQLPTSPKGWAVALLAALAGLIAGFVTIRLLNSLIG